MKPMMSRLLRAGILAGGLLAAGAGVAHADETTGGQGGLLAGNQVLAPITVPVTASGDALGVLGLDGRHHSGHRSHHATGKAPTRHHRGADSTATSGSTGTTWAPTSIPAARTSGRGGLASGNQVIVPVQVPVTFGGDAIALLGRSDARGHSGPAAGSGSTGSGATTSGSAPTTSGGDGVASGNQVLIPVCAPVNANGDAVSVLGGAGGTGASSGCGASASTAPVTPTDPTGPTAPTSLSLPSPPATGSPGATPGASVLGLHLVDAAADAAPTTGTLAMTGARPIPLVLAGIVLIVTGVLLWRGRSTSRERDF